MYRRRKWVLFMGAVLLLEAVTIFQLLSTPQEERAIELNGQSFPLEMIGSQPLFVALLAAVLAADLAADEPHAGTTFRFTLPVVR